MNGKPATQEDTYKIIPTQYFQISYHRIFLCFLQASSTRLQTVEEDGSVGCIFRSVREEIFESNLPRLRILIVQELKELGWLLLAGREEK
jgi:hypothetical protein